MGRILTGAALAAALAASGAAQAGKFKVLHSFCSGHHRFCGDGSTPQGGLVMDAAGNFYGTAANAGQRPGAVFELERKEGGKFKFRTLYRFCGNCGRNPNGSLIIDTAGNLYGTADDLVFELSPGDSKTGWIEKILYRFCSQQGCTDGDAPVGGLTYAGATAGVPYDGTSPLYGATIAGGADNAGTVFELINNAGHWNEAVLYSFCSQSGSDCLDGRWPNGGLILDVAGNLYGTTSAGGGNNDGTDTSGSGTAFELSPTGQSWSEIVLYRFCSTDRCADGAAPVGNVAMDPGGNIYGATFAGGEDCPRNKGFGCGVVYKIVPDGLSSAETLLYTFCRKDRCRDGYGPQAGLLLDSQGNLFGTTWFGGGNDDDVDGQGGGVVFKVSSDTGAYDVLHSFCSAENCADGEYPLSSLVMEPSGRLMGTASLGGAFGGEIFGGVAFELKPK